MAQMVKNPPAMWETWVWSLGQEDPLEKGIATHSRIIAWRIPWTQEPGGLQPIGSQSQTGLKWISTHVCYISRNAGLDEAQAGIKISRSINNLKYADGTTLIAEDEEELKSLLMKVKEESEKVGLKLSFQKTKIMSSGPITSWQIDGETVTDFILGAPKSLQMVTAAMKLKDPCSLEENLWPT